MVHPKLQSTIDVKPSIGSANVGGDTILTVSIGGPAWRMQSGDAVRCMPIGTCELVTQHGALTSVTQQRIDSLKLICDIAVHRFIEVTHWPGSLYLAPQRLLQHQLPAIQRLYSTCGPIALLAPP